MGAPSHGRPARSSGYFSTLGHPRLGRAFDQDDENGMHRVVFSDRVWRTHFGGDPRSSAARPPHAEPYQVAENPSARIPGSDRPSPRRIFGMGLPGTVRRQQLAECHRRAAQWRQPGTGTAGAGDAEITHAGTLARGVKQRDPRCGCSKSSSPTREAPASGDCRACPRPADCVRQRRQPRCCASTDVWRVRCAAALGSSRGCWLGTARREPAPGDLRGIARSCPCRQRRPVLQRDGPTPCQAWIRSNSMAVCYPLPCPRSWRPPYVRYCSPLAPAFARIPSVEAFRHSHVTSLYDEGWRGCVAPPAPRWASLHLLAGAPICWPASTGCSKLRRLRVTRMMTFEMHLPTARYDACAARPSTGSEPAGS